MSLLSSRAARRAIGPVALAAALLGTAASAQQPAQPPPPPAGQPAGQPAPARQPGAPAPAGQPGAPAPAGQMPAQPINVGQPGQPGQPPTRPMRPMPGQLGGPPGMPPGHPPIPGMAPGGANAPRPGGKAPERAPAPKKRTAEECSGHGPLDPPHHVNWWRGILFVNNERAQREDFLNRLLFRYHNELDECDPKNDPPPYLAQVLNFGILLLIFYKFGRKPIAEALQKRRQAIMGEIDNATRLLNEAKARLAEYEDKFEHIEETFGQLKAEYAAQAEIEKKHILAEAEERRARLKRDAEFRIEQELKSAKVALLEEAVLGAVKAAEEIVRQRATTQDQERLAQDYLSAVPEALARGPQAGAALGGRS